MEFQIIQLLNGEDIATEDTAQAVPEAQVTLSVSRRMHTYTLT